MNQLAQQITSLVNDKKFLQALALCQQELSQRPNHPGFLALAGQAACHAGKFQQCQEYFSSANQAAPNNVSILDAQAKAYIHTRHFSEAIPVIEQRLGLQETATALNNMGYCYQSIENWNEAKKYYTQALSLNINNDVSHYHLGEIEQNNGDFASAAEHFNQSIETNSNYIPAYTRLLQSGFITSINDPIIKKVHNLIDDGNVTEAFLGLYLALADTYDKLNEPEKSFHYLKLGNNKIRELNVHYNIDHDKKLYDRIKTTLTKEFFDTHSGSGIPDASPIFITGMPRSGTTLVEQILSSHPLVHGAGEITILDDLTNKYDIRKQYPLRLLSLDNDKIRAIAQDYLDLTNALSPKHNVITNKSVMNTFNVGFIKQLFPNAKIIHCTRNPIDTCFSCYTKHFRGSLPYAYNLEELGQYYLMYQDLMNHWEKTLPGFMLEFNYEKLIENQEQQTRLLLEYCNLDWDDACLDFHNNKRAVITSSMSQVRKPIYKTPVKAWEKYKDQLKPLIDILKSGKLYE